MKKAGHRGTTAKHAGSTKASHHPAKAKHSPSKTVSRTISVHGQKITVKVTMPSHAKARGLAGAGLLADVACCPFQALAAGLELSGHGPVSDAAVLALHWEAGACDTEGAPLHAALAACCDFGLDGVRPLVVAEAPLDDPSLPLGKLLGGVEHVDLGEVDHDLRESPVVGGVHKASVILGLELPGPHAVCVAPDGCWVSWGQHYDPAAWPEAVVEEAWAVTWP